jgi:hypothetical protein
MHRELKQREVAEKEFVARTKATVQQARSSLDAKLAAAVGE